MRKKRFILVVLSFLTIMSVKAQYNIQCEDTCDHVHGLDMSHYQGDVWWETVAKNSNHKLNYVYLKATEGQSWVDKRYYENIQAAKRNGMNVGSYHFYRPNVPQEDQVRNFRAQCRPQDQDLIPMVDIETTSGLNDYALRDSLTKFLDLMTKEYGVRPLVYTYTNFYNKHLVGALAGYKLFIAQYTHREPVLSDGRDIFAWQYTGKGYINGVRGYVDKSRLMGKHSIREIRFPRKKSNTRYY
ncbi:glycoside hydrolase family 25 protein [Prevotella disiens]|uniref:Glycosyl hydrolase family 25 n=4 Tax=Prevotella disiens TaxID=28130 RepID=A0A3E4QKG4_9BACT|nr:GH25 family lysozyme [Prevotella disiens]RGL00768.1 glycosyl hydrolase family 25 [Prevotella disiens]